MKDSKDKEYYWLNDKSRTFLERGYLLPNQTPEQRIDQIAAHAEKILGIEGFGDKFINYMSKGWISLSTPVWSNFGAGRGLPISCNGSLTKDSLDSILYKVAEVGMLSKYGAGTSTYLGELRARGSNIKDGGKTNGPVHFCKLFESTADTVSQSGVRRGNCVVCLPVEHPDILEFLQIRGDGHSIQNLSIGVTITDKWMNDMIDGNKVNRKIWGKIIEKRCESGYPYIFFTDTVNNNAPQVYKDKNKKIYASNLCQEICLSSSEDETFVCNLSSLNLIHYEDWKDTDLIETVTYFLDAVMTDYIKLVKDIPFLDHAYNFAVRQRALGLGVLGWHSYLQSQNIPFESMDAKYKNVEIFKLIKEKTIKASQELAAQFGEPELLKGHGLRNATLVAIAPTTSSSFILGQVSPSIEPLNSNYFVKDLAKGKFTYKNPYLKEVLKKYEKDDSETWKSILMKGGSIQHLDYLSDHEKEVFKTFGEISQKEIVIQGAQRQKYIDQSQSLNLMIHPDVSPKEISQLLIFGWQQGVKTFYYQRSTNPAQELGRSLLACKNCES